MEPLSICNIAYCLPKSDACGCPLSVINIYIKPAYVADMSCVTDNDLILGIFKVAPSTASSPLESTNIGLQSKSRHKILGLYVGEPLECISEFTFCSGAGVKTYIYSAMVNLFILLENFHFQNFKSHPLPCSCWIDQYHSPI